MKKKILCIALIGAFGVAPAAFAQDYDDRWYLTAATGLVDYDSERGLSDDIYGSIGLGKFFNPNWSVDVDVNYSNPMRSAPANDLRWSQPALGITPRYHFRGDGRNWGPFVGLGAGVVRAYESFSDPMGGPPLQRKDNVLYVQPSLGLQADYGRVGGRVEAAYRYSFDDSSIHAPDKSGFGDMIYSVGLIVKLGPEPVAPVAPAPPPPPPPPPPAPPAERPGPLTIDLRGVNFDFDRATLRPDAITSLNETIQILRNYPDLRVEVAGHTDLCGSETYNQGLSERRARAVYEHLTANGISSNRLVGPVGYGESRPLVNTPQTHPECRNETNRRTELNVQN